jgi:hypothetical protein
VIPGSPSYSSDGRYLIYDSVRCSVPTDETLHVRNLSTGKEQTDPGSFSGLSSRAVFLHADQQVAAIQGGGKLTVWQLPSFAVKAYAAPDGCQYQTLAGTETKLVATLQCGSKDTLSLVSVSPATFTVTKTLARLGSCLSSTDLSLAAGDPAAMLAETVTACGSPPQARIVEISGPTVTRVRSGSQVKLPSQLVW